MLLAAMSLASVEWKIVHGRMVVLLSSRFMAVAWCESLQAIIILCSSHPGAMCWLVETTGAMTQGWQVGYHRSLQNWVTPSHLCLMHCALSMLHRAYTLHAASLSQFACASRPTLSHQSLCLIPFSQSDQFENLCRLPLSDPLVCAARVSWPLVLGRAS